MSVLEPIGPRPASPLFEPASWRAREDHPGYYHIYHPDGSPFDAEDLPLQRTALAGLEERDVEILHRTPDGREFTAVFNASPLRDGNGRIMGAVAVGRDVTRQRRLEAERERLLRETGRHAAELASANKELEAFTYSVTHDLRSPVRHMDGFSKALLRDYAGALDERGKQYLEFVREGSEKMGHLIDDLLTLTGVARSALQRADVDVSEMAQSAAMALRREQPERQVDFVIAPGIVAKGDQRLLRLVLDNLLVNAWKFTSGREYARIEFGAIQQEGKTVYYVRDNGAGFNNAYAHKLFRAFERLHSQAEFPGSGIGLARVERVVRCHGGRVWAEGEELIKSRRFTSCLSDCLNRRLTLIEGFR